MIAFRRQGMNGAFETIEIVRNTIDHNFESFIVFVSADFAFIHKQLFVIRVRCPDLVSGFPWPPGSSDPARLRPRPLPRAPVWPSFHPPRAQRACGGPWCQGPDPI